jgi:hypothetical protein
MFNPDKQTRAANGQFGKKTVVAEVEDVAEAVLEVGREIVDVVEAGYKTINQRINDAKPGEIVILDGPFDYPKGVTNKRTGWIILAIGLAVAVGLFLLTGCISVRH